MRNTTPSHQGNVVPFPQRLCPSQSLTKRDKQEVADFMPYAEGAGYDALMIHIVAADEGFGARDYVSAYRTGEAWSSWGFARNGEIICSWNALTSKDSGTFETMSQALGCILTGASCRPGQAHAETH